MIVAPDLAVDCFSDDYQTARGRFRAAASRAGGRLWSLPVGSQCGPAGEPLTIEIAWWGDRRPQRVLLHTSGLHGVEGFPGSAVQLAALSQATARPVPPDGAALVMVHVINPWGMAWLRRGDDSNVDLNRNFLASPGDFTTAGCPPLYPRMDPWLNPTSPPRFDFFTLKVAAMVTLYGYSALKQTVAGGQYTYSQGLFFGGYQPAAARSVYKAWLAEHLAGVQRVVTVDVHTGLGRWGEDLLLIDRPAEEPQSRQMAAAFGGGVQFLHDDGRGQAHQGIAYITRGGHHEGIAAAVAPAESWFVTQEFGTLGPIGILYALREENRLFHHGDGAGNTGTTVPLDHPTKQGLVAAFSPRNKIWRAKAVGHGLRRLAQAAELAFG